MILFCEDCGQKNSLDPDQVVNNKVHFRCTICKYLNNYTLPDQTRKFTTHYFKKKTDSFTKKADNYLKKINDYPSVKGYFIYHFQTGLLHKSKGLELNEQTLFALGKILSKNFFICTREYGDIKELGVAYNNQMIFISHICNNIFIAVINKSSSLSNDLKTLLGNSVNTLNKIICN